MISTFKLSLMGLGAVCLAFFSLTTFSDSASDLPKAVWLQQVRDAVAVPICKSFMDDESIVAQMKLQHISYDHCVSLIPGIAVKCEKKYDANIPPTIDDVNAEKWGRVIGECIGNDFAIGHLYSEVH